MNKSILALAGVMAIAATGLVGMFTAAPAEAQSGAKAPVILVVDREKIVTQSTAGKTIPSQAEKVRASVASELEGEANKLKSDIEKYQKNASLMSDEVRQKTEQELTVRQQYGLPQRVQIMEQAFNTVVQNAQAKILIESQPILKDIVESRGATILLDRSVVMYSSVDADITQEVLEKLNKKMKSVEVREISLKEIEEQFKKAQAEAQKAKK